MNFCTNCGQKPNGIATFCMGCGTPLTKTTNLSNWDKQNGENINANTEIKDNLVKTCSKCGKEVTGTIKFCTDCGNSLGDENNDNQTVTQHNCSNCGKELNPDAKFCMGCGTSKDGGVNTHSNIQTMNNHQQNKEIVNGKNTLANVSYWSGIVSIGTDVLFFITPIGWLFLIISTILEITAVITGITALSLKQDEKKAKHGITLGAIGLVLGLLFLLIN